MGFREFLTERFINLSVSDMEKRAEIVDDVWDILQASYKPIGGIHGNGFRSKEDMMKSIPFWKVIRKNGKIVTVAMYKDSGGRKLVAAGTNGSEEGKLGLADIISKDLTMQRGYTELSGKLLKFIVNVMGTENVAKFLIRPEVFSKVRGEEISAPSKDDPEIKVHPRLKDFFYQREIGGELHTKVALGTVGKRIEFFEAS